MRPQILGRPPRDFEANAKSRLSSQQDRQVLIDDTFNRHTYDDRLVHVTEDDVFESCKAVCGERGWDKAAREAPEGIVTNGYHPCEGFPLEEGMKKLVHRQKHEEGSYYEKKKCIQTFTQERSDEKS
jgi:hypothetical protein